MSTGITTAILVGALAAALAGSAAAGQSSPPDMSAESQPPATAVPNHALSGVVKSVDATTLVVTRAGKQPAEMTFVLGPSTQRQGPIGVGATVQVRFRAEGHTPVATAILVIPPKRHTGTKAP